MKFTEYTYKRPDYEQYKKDFLRLVETLKAAGSLEEVKETIDKISELSASIETMGTLASIRHTIDTKDAFYEEEDNYWNEYSPYYQELSTTYYNSKHCFLAWRSISQNFNGLAVESINFGMLFYSDKFAKQFHVIK